MTAPDPNDPAGSLVGTFIIGFVFGVALIVLSGLLELWRAW